MTSGKPTPGVWITCRWCYGILMLTEAEYQKRTRRSIYGPFCSHACANQAQAHRRALEQLQAIEAARTEARHKRPSDLGYPRAQDV